jgi:2,5-diamino-6-(ribosylamino)-4(3H)-pyrimidinone 5'-phosphate reductase
MKPYVICHMMPSVDGRLRTERWDVPKAGHDEYDRVAESYNADAWICGRKTMEEFASGHWRSRRATSRVPRTDHVIARKKGERYAIAIDKAGKLAWKSNRVQDDQLITVLGEDASAGYLEFLRERGISYVFARKKQGELDLGQALEKLRDKFGIKKLMLEGGGETNGSFLRQGLVDELSMLLTPVADGGTGEPALFDVEAEQPKHAVAKLRLKNVRRARAGMLWIQYKVRNPR